MEEQKKCKKCGTTKSLEDFNVNKNSKDGKESSCSLCRAENKRRIRREKHEGVYKSTFDLSIRAERFKEDAHLLHQGIYTYERINYVNNTTPIEIFCTKHKGYFWQIPMSHSNGIGCKQCGITRRSLSAKKTQEEFLLECKLVHGEDYDYSDSLYQDYHTNVSIGCNACRVSFAQTPATHLRGSGCPTCSAGGYSRSAEGTLYVLIAGDVTKVGITNLNPDIRESYLTSAARKIDPDFPNFKRIYSKTWLDGNIAYDAETTLLTYLRKRYESIPHKFNGSTECFLNVNLEDLMPLLPAV